MIKISILYTSIICLFLLGQQHSKEPQKDGFLVNIDLQENFKNDTLDLQVNNTVVVKHIVLNSTVAGFTSLSIKVICDNANEFKIAYRNQIRYCHSSAKIKLALKLNGKRNFYVIDPRKEKWVGLGRSDDNTLNLRQQTNPFLYE